MKVKKEINDFYDLSSCCDDDLEVVGVLLILLDLKPTQKMINELLGNKLKNHSENIELVLDHLTIRTIREIVNIRELKKEQLECVSKQ